MRLVMKISIIMIGLLMNSSIIFAQTATPGFPPIPTPYVTPTPDIETGQRIDHYYITGRPILRDRGRGVDYVERSYAFGSTQQGRRQVHLGVEFVNARFMPIQAPADGFVVYAGTDENILFGPRLDYYGNLVVLQHSFASPDEYPVFTLYGHLQDIDVTIGQSVKQGERLGRVGDSGVAVGPHLHFEVRVGEDVQDYTTVRNPELWLAPKPKTGTLAGLAVDESGSILHDLVILVRSNSRVFETYTYGDGRVTGDPLWNENFTIGDLLAGEYEVIVRDSGGFTRFRQDVVIEEGKTTWIDIQLSGR